VQVGIVSIRDALTLAEERGLDLVEVAPNAVPPVCRVMDYGKYRYEQTKKEREARKNQKQVELKQIRLEPKTDDHDVDVKTNQARRFLLDGDKVKFNMRFRGREIFHPDIGREILERIAEALRDVATVEQRPLMEGRVLSLTLAPSVKVKQPQRNPGPPRERDTTNAPSRQQAEPAAVAAPAPSDDQGEQEDKE
jgi:translation initiation factor IF-3